MNELLSPKQVARAIDVSESSVKRWCDAGTIPMRRTAGGHRRIHVSDVLEFLRDRKQELVRPEVLGLPAGIRRARANLEQAREIVRHALIEGDETSCRRAVFDLYLAECRLSMIFDEVLAEAFREIGDLWSCGDVEVYQERRGCEICIRLLHEIRMVLPGPPRKGPMAVGGTPEGDSYVLPTSMIELVLRENGWNAVSLGSSLPFPTLSAAARDHQPKLFWLSASHLPDEEKFLTEYQAFSATHGDDMAIAIGGNALNDGLRNAMTSAVFCEKLSDLENLAKEITTDNGHSPENGADD